MEQANTYRDPHGEGPLTARQPIEWQAHEYIHVEKSPDWFWALGLIAIAGSVAAIIYNNVLFAVFILLAAFVLALFASRHPSICRFAITQRGVRIDDALYPYNNIESFAIDEVSPDHTPKLILKPKKIFSSLIVIPIEGVDPDDVHDFLASVLVEDDHIEPFSHRLMEWFGF